MTKISRRSFLKGIGLTPLYFLLSPFFSKFRGWQAGSANAQNIQPDWPDVEKSGVIPKGTSRATMAGKVILKVKVKREQTKAKTHYTYPPEYDASRIQVLCYESGLPENLQQVIARGNKDEYLLGVVRAEDAEQFLKCPDIEEITKEYALKLGNIWTRQTERVTDNNRVLTIHAKYLRGERLSRKDLQALDPKHPEPGINLTRSFADALDEYLS